MNELINILIKALYMSQKYYKSNFSAKFDITHQSSLILRIFLKLRIEKYEPLNSFLNG